MRILALAVLAAIIVVSGIWLARDRSPTPATASTDPPTSVSTPSSVGVVADAQTSGSGEASEESSEGAPELPADPASATGDDAAADQTASGDAVVPLGYSQVPYLSDVPQQAFDAPAQVLEPDLDYMAVIRTTAGDITVDLYEDMTPETVNNFVFLALHRYYEDVPFHRVLDGFMAQTGDPTGTGMGGPGYQFDDEIVEGLAFDSEGTLAMANAGTGPDGAGTNGSQFFITFGPTTWLNGAHTIFGHVTEGLDVLPSITRVDPSQPSAIVLYSGTVADLADEGVELPADPTANIAEAIEELLGALPSAGQSFSVAGHRGVSGMLGTEPAFGFYRTPDEIESVIIAARAR